MKIKDFLAQVAYLGTVDICGESTQVYKSNFDDSYMTHIGMEDGVKFLAVREITQELTHGVGFSPKDNKWYGWSHRAIYGFAIGSTCKKGNCHYVGSSLKEQEEAAVAFWADEDHINTHCKGIVEQDGKKFFDIRWSYNDKVKNKKIRNTTGGTLHFITPLGRGEWVAKTMADAKQMAIDFNEGVS